MSAELMDCQVRPRRSIFLVAATSFALAFSALGVAPATASDSGPAVDSWQAAAGAASSTPAALTTEVADGYLKLVVVRDVNGSPVIETAFLRSKADLDKALRDLKSDPSVISVESESQVMAFSTPPYFTSQWGITTVASESVSATSQGAGIVVAVIDSGVDANNPDLVGRVIDGVDYRDGISYVNNQTGLIDNCVSYTDARYVGKPDHADFGKYDPDGHGTHVAGIIASNSIRVKSVAPQATIMPVRVLSSSGSGDVSDVACGIIYAANNGARVINMSLGLSLDEGTDIVSPALSAAVAYAITKNVVVVAASGNDGTTGINTYPAALPDVIGVGAISNNSGQPIVWFSNRGSYVDVVAPGVGIWSTCSSPSTTCTTTDGDSNYELLSGTSMATPFVAGLAALILSIDQNLQFSDVASIITTSAVDKGAVGPDQIYGFGLINAPQAIQKAQEVSARLASERAAAAEAARLAAERAAAAEAARIVAEQARSTAKAKGAEKAAVAAKKLAESVSLAKKSLSAKALTRSRISIKVKAPKGSKTFIQLKVGKTWKNVAVRNTTASTVIKVSRSGIYRVQIRISNVFVTSKPIEVK